ncbi:MAG: ATP-dependent zinc metalloprotease FtsH [Defluviitaleaceae bacterium]|nr:ATP-dependent zinc metalloprotease FtsH [Defluviitaleaceae bacterium]
MSIYTLIVIFILLMFMAFRLTDPAGTREAYTLDNLMSDIHAGNVARVEISINPDVADTGNVRAFFYDSAGVVARTESVYVPWLSRFAGDIEAAQAEHGLTVVTMPPPRTNVVMQFLFPAIIIGVMIFLIFIVMQQMQGGGGGGGGNKVMNFGKSRAKLSAPDDKKKITFEMVAGLEEEKHELSELVDFLKNPKKFVDIGARIPKGVLLVGPPGTGKTYLAKAVSGEAGVPFFSISGSDFVEMFVGVGASRVRDLFEQAKKNSPCIVFIDEIDAVGRRRGAGLGGGHDEREQTLNQLLVEMDGFGVNEGVIIVAATNRPDILDPALLRPGRFDRRVVVGRPDVKGREEVLKIHAKGKKIAADVDFGVIAHTTAGFTPADLENLLNEAALLAARVNKTEIDMEELRKAFVKVGIGAEKKSKVISEKEKRITAYHEGGHAILFEMLPELDPVHMISIIPTGMAGGYTMHLPGEDKSYMSKTLMEQQIVALLGGRAAEELVLKDITTGASNDIERATNIARAMVTKYGMSDKLGPINLGDDNNEVFIGRDWGHTRNYGENIASEIDAEIKNMVDTAYKKAMAILSENMDVLNKITDVLMEKEKITGAEFRALFPEGKLTHKEKDNKTMFAESGNIVAPEESPMSDDSGEL